MGFSRHAEVERKFESGPSVSLPSLADIEGVSSMGQAVEMKLMAVYFDTDDFALARRGITLRRRTGGEDAGWHLKLPVAKDTRTEVRLPLGRGSKAVPAALLGPVRAMVRDRPLGQVARVRTRRLEYDLIGPDDVVLAKICDDEVHAERLDGAGPVQDWREWEVELVDGTNGLLDSVERRLLAAGASPAGPSKLVRTLGDLVPPQPERPSRKQLSRGSAAQLVLAHIGEHTEELHQQDARLRADLPGSVHKLRIATRRLRSALKTYQPLLASADADHLGDELRWLGQSLSRARDAQVMRERLQQMIAAEPIELVLGPVSQRIDDDLSSEYKAGHEQGVAAVETERYFRLLDALDQLISSPALTSEADAPARQVIPRLLERDAKRLRRAVREVSRTETLAERDLALHEARKKAKRLRYAAESAIPVFPRRAKNLATAVKRVQETLGEHQDAVVARDKLREYGARTHLSGENGFTFGRLHALEQARAEDAVRRFEAAWDRLDVKKMARMR